MSKDRKIMKMNTPLGTFKWPKLTEPDYGTKDYPKPDGEYSVKVIFEGNDPAFIAFREKMEAFMGPVVAAGERAFAELKKPQRDKLGGISVNDLFTPVYDENEETTGQYEMKFSMKASGVVKKGPREGQKWQRAPQLFDALGRRIKAKIDVWGGTEGIIAFSFVEDGYFIPATGAVGLKLQLEAAQIVTLRQGGERSASDYGFGKQEGGFSADEIEADEDEADDFHTPGSDAEEGIDNDPAGASDF